MYIYIYIYIHIYKDTASADTFQGHPSSSCSECCAASSCFRT